MSNCEFMIHLTVFLKIAFLNHYFKNHYFEIANSNGPFAVEA